jgi:hypothetical protein
MSEALKGRYKISKKDVTMRTWAKYFKLGTDGKIAILIILFALSLRMTLMAYWPPSDSDESFIGLQAMHIAYHSEHPIFLYGQYYMGTLEPFVGALFFHLFGVSVFSFRLTTALLFALFLVSMYCLTSLLYSKKLALIVLLLLSLGTRTIFTPEIMVEGGAVESLLFGSLLMLLASWLAFTARKSEESSQQRLRLAVFGCWGFIAGIGLWSDYLICPFLLMSGLLLAIFCIHEWRTRALIYLLTGFMIGALQLIIYNIHPSPGQNSLQVILSLQHSAQPGTVVDAMLVVKEWFGTILFSLPMITGLSSPCLLGDLPLFGATTINAHTIACTTFNGSWGLGYIVLLLLGVFVSIRTLRELRRLYQAKPAAWPEEKRQAAALHVARFALLAGAGLTILLYALSPVAAQRPWSTRYLTCLLIALPAILWPLWNGFGIAIARRLPVRLAAFAGVCRRGILLLLVAMLILGTIFTFQAVPAAAAIDQQEYGLVHDLLALNVTHVYSEYWTCGRLMFQSQERIICAVVNEQMNIDYNRYEPYALTVAADPQAAYIFPTDPIYASYVNNFAQMVASSNQLYRRYIFDAYIVYVPYG